MAIAHRNGLIIETRPDQEIGWTNRMSVAQLADMLRDMPCASCSNTGRICDAVKGQNADVALRET